MNLRCRIFLIYSCVCSQLCFDSIQVIALKSSIRRFRKSRKCVSTVSFNLKCILKFARFLLFRFYCLEAFFCLDGDLWSSSLNMWTSLNLSISLVHFMSCCIASSTCWCFHLQSWGRSVRWFESIRWLVQYHRNFSYFLSILVILIIYWTHLMAW